MWPLVVVSMTPVLCHAPNLVERGEHESVQYFGAEGAVEAFDVGVLGRFAGLDVDQGDAMLLCPLPERSADELRAVVQAQSPWSTTQLDQFVQCRMTRAEGRLVSISIFIDSRLKSSLMLKVRKRRPDHKASDMKSADHVWFAACGISSGARMRSGNRRLPRRGRLSFSAV